ncbi:MAG: hypothetical protein GTO60_11820, partial [Gammaproteobacteria bacterium]|nr:hypothetical protein [Gammaproteobacteria bacterium]NIO63005.1 hypothetical protein [Gammaproteobacteria bacterium]
MSYKGEKMFESKKRTKFPMRQLVLFWIMLFFSSAVQAAQSPYAETVILNAKVITSDNDDPDQVTIAEAVA